MKTKRQYLLILTAAFVLATISSQLAIAFAQGTAFTYQGRLNDGANPAGGIYDLRFAIYDSLTSGTQQGVLVTNAATAVSNGLFTVTLDFGNQFPGTPRWLEIGVRTNGGVSFFTLSPRQALTSAPYAIMADSASNLLGTLPATQLSAGTAGINITGSAASVTGGFAGDVTGTQNATVATLVGGVTAVNVAAAANAANAATSGDTPGAIVKRDGSGNFSAASLTLDNTLTLPDTTATIYSGASTVMRADGFRGNFFAGGDAGNLAITGGDNTGVGYFALVHDTSGNNNTANGFEALYFNTNGSGNVANGQEALYSNTSGSGNVASGFQALLNNTSGANNTANGFVALYSDTNGSYNTADGASALNFNVTGNYNAAFGYLALPSVSTGSDNIGVGHGALLNLQTGSGNIGIGLNSGSAILTGNNNIDIGNAGFGDESGVIRIGTAGTHTKAVFNGIFGTTVGGGATVQVNASGLLGTVTSSRRFKQNIQSMADASDVLLALHPVTFQYKPDLDPEGTPQFGLIAEDVEKVDPALVLHDDQHQIYTVRYEAVNAMLLNEFLKEHRKVEDQDVKLQELSQKVETQNSENSELKQRLAGLEQFIHNQK